MLLATGRPTSDTPASGLPLACKITRPTSVKPRRSLIAIRLVLPRAMRSAR